MAQEQTDGNDAVAAAWEYAKAYYKDSGATDALGVLARHRPEVFAGYIALRQGAYSSGDSEVLPPRIKELIILAIEISCRKTNPPPLGHTRRAVANGATVEEIAEVVSLCIMIAGMLTYHESGLPVLQEAERCVAALATESATS